MRQNSDLPDFQKSENLLPNKYPYVLAYAQKLWLYEGYKGLVQFVEKIRYTIKLFANKCWLYGSASVFVVEQVFPGLTLLVKESNNLA